MGGVYEIWVKRGPKWAAVYATKSAAAAYIYAHNRSLKNARVEIRDPAGVIFYEFPEASVARGETRSVPT